MNSILRAAVPTPLRQQVVDIVRNAITECMFEPGGRLTERELCESLNVSRSTVREGLRQLEAEGLVKITPNKGPMVATLTREEAANIYDIRATLEGLAAALAAEKAEPKALREMQRHLQSMCECAAAEDFIGLQKSKTQFYEALFTSTNNPPLHVMLKQLRAQVTLLRGLDVERATRMAESIRGGRDIITAVTARDIEAARRAGEEHIRRAARLALDAAAQQPQEETLRISA